MAVELNSDLRVEQPKAVQADLAKKISPQLTEAIRKDILILTSKFGGMDPMEQLGDRTKGQDIETRAGAAVQDAAEIDWSRYLELCLANFEMETQPLQAQAVRIDWDFLLNWTPSDGKTLEENLADLAARYQSLWRVITENFSGAQQMELLARLDMVMMAKLNELFQSDLGRLYDFLAENGQREAAEAIRPSVQRAGFALAHRERPAAQRTEAGGRGARMPAEESGRPIHGGRLARAQGDARTQEPVPPGRRAAVAGKSPLVFLAPKELRQARNFIIRLEPPDYGPRPDTEQAAFLKLMDTAVLTLKTEVFFQNADLSPGFADTMRRAMERFLTAREPLGQLCPAGEARTERTVRPQAAQQEPPQFEKAAQTGFPAAQERTDTARKEAAEVSRCMSETLARTGSVRQAVLNGARYARSMAQERGEAHHEKEQIFWRTLLFGSGENARRKAPMQLIRENWNQFVRSMEFQRERARELYFGAYESGGLQASAKGGGGLRNAVTAGAFAVFLLLPPLIVLLAGHPGLAAGLFGLDLCLAFALGTMRRR